MKILGAKLSGKKTSGKKSLKIWVYHAKWSFSLEILKNAVLFATNNCTKKVRFLLSIFVQICGLTSVSK